MNENICCAVNDRKETIKDSVVEQRDMLINLIERLDRIADEIGSGNDRPSYEEVGVSNLSGALRNNNVHIHVCHEIVAGIIDILGL